MNINTLIEQAHSTAKSKGFWDKERNRAELLMLIVSELAEALEADRKQRHCSLTKSELEVGLHLSELNFKKEENKQAFIEFYNNEIKGSFEEEIADTLIRLFDLVGGMNIDVTTHILLKMKFNETRERLHGKKY
jgi:NTP pyrophosphatase (non-canonical NTP hydrolase)